MLKGATFILISGMRIDRSYQDSMYVYEILFSFHQS